MLDAGQLGARVDTDQLGLASLDDAAAKTLPSGQCDYIGKIVLGLRILIVDPVEKAKEVGRIDGHHAGVAELHGQLLGVGFLGLDDGLQHAVGIDNQAAIRTRVRGPKSEYYHGGAGRGSARLQHARQGRLREQRRIPIDDQDVALEPFERGPRRHHGVSGFQPFFLHDYRVWRYRATDRFHLFSDDDHQWVGRERF